MNTQQIKESVEQETNNLRKEIIELRKNIRQKELQIKYNKKLLTQINRKLMKDEKGKKQENKIQDNPEEQET